MDYISQKTRWNKSVFIVLSLSIVALVSALNLTVFNFLPKSHYYLEPGTPHPEFKLAYRKIKDIGFSEEMLIISPYPVIDRIYLQKSDYCLAMHLNVSTKKIRDLGDYDHYTNTKNILTVGELDEIIKNNHGYIIIDHMAISDRLDPEIIDLIFQQELVHKSDYRFNHYLWLFKF